MSDDKAPKENSKKEKEEKEEKKGDSLVKEEAQPKAEKEDTEDKTEEPPKQTTEKKSRNKITRMSLAEVERALKEVRKNMGGGDHSRHAKALVARRKQLLEEQPKENRKAA